MAKRGQIEKPQAPPQVTGDSLTEQGASQNSESPVIPEEVPAIATQPPVVEEKPKEPPLMASLPTYDPDKYYLVEKPGFEHMIATLKQGNPAGLANYSNMALATKIGEMFGLRRGEPDFYEKAKAVMNEISSGHYKRTRGE
jgi:hypothetical protein